MTQPLDHLVDSLQRAFEDGFRGQEIAESIGSYARTNDDWRDFALFGEESYTRNLVFHSERFEILILCWGAGQESPIHNHEGQDCWMAVLDGDVEEARYPTPKEVRPGPLTPRESKVFARGQVAYIHDDIGLHLVRGFGGSPAVSLHLYAKPYDACNVYCPETGKISRKTFQNHSVRGRLVAEGVR